MRRVKKTVWGTVFSDARVGGIGWQEDEIVALGAQQVDDPGRFVRRQVVGDEADQKGSGGSFSRRKDLSGPQSGCEFVLDIGLETGPVHRAVQDPGGDQAV